MNVEIIRSLRLLLVAIVVSVTLGMLYLQFHLTGLKNLSFQLNGTQAVDRLVDEPFSFERRDRCNVNSEGPCHSTNKSLVLTFWNEESKTKWVSQNIHLAFPSHSFDHLIFVYDNSSWQSHPAYHQSIWIHVHGQIRLWFAKRFLPAQMIRSYKYIWIVDDDSRLWFNPLHYQCVIEQLRIPMSAPGRLGGALSNPIVKVDEKFKPHIGRWTDFVETGPTVVVNSSAWLCLYRYLDPSVGSGWGLDLIQCNILADLCLPKTNRTRVCAILDAFRIEHQADSVKSSGYGAPELGFFERSYRNYFSEPKNYEPLATNLSVFDKCSQ